MKKVSRYQLSIAGIKIKLKKGDLVQVKIGKDRGKQEKIEQVNVKEGTVLLPSLNQYKKHVKPQQDRLGEIVTLSRPVRIANVAFFCTTCKQPVRLGYRITGDKKVRICRSCESTV